LPQLDQKLNDLATLSIRLADSSHNANTSTKVLDLKKNWAKLKTLVTQQAGSLKVSYSAITGRCLKSTTASRCFKGMTASRLGLDRCSQVLYDMIYCVSHLGDNKAASNSPTVGGDS